MDIFQVFRDRRSIRRYKDKPVEPEKINQVLDAAHQAPSGKNLQCWRFPAINNQARRKALLGAFPDDKPGTRAIATGL